PPPPPPPPTGNYTVVSSHPRLLDFTSVPSKAASTDGLAILQQVEASVDGVADTTGDRLICGAFLVRYAQQFGQLPPGVTWKQTVAQYQAQAIADLLTEAATNTASGIGNYGLLRYTLAPLACGYDWLFNVMTPTQQTTVRTALRTIMDTRTFGGASAQGGQTFYQWYSANNVSGFGMTAALATYGEFSDKEYVADYYNNNWWVPNGFGTDKGYNWWCVRNNLLGGGDREGFGYFWGLLPNWACKAFWESATSNTDLSLQNMPYFNQYPYWVLFQTERAYIKNYPIFSIHTIEYSGELDYDRAFMEYLMCSTSWSDANGKKLARWLLDQSLQYVYGAGSVGRLLMFGLIIGDPRVVGAPPDTLGLPLTRDLIPIGEHFERSDWTTNATCLYFGCASHQSRVYPQNDVTIWKGGPLVCHGMQRYFHDYGFECQKNRISFYKAGAAGPAFNQVEADPETIPLGTLVKNSDGSYTGDCTALMTSAGSLVKLSRRTMTPNIAAGLVTVFDEVQCDATLTPHACWNTPNQPQIAGFTATGVPIPNTQTMTFVNGSHSATFTFSQPVTVIPIGGIDSSGVNHMIDGLDGKPYTPDSSRYMSPKFLAQDVPTQIKWGGYWRVHVLMPAGGGTLTTRIQVQ
ncbi:MAG TPA: hypothetical protein VKU82_12245, partial [Planctomycetaceae bacterium]|nr:hypothetical protein [Planctomycetaceae bacterium]